MFDKKRGGLPHSNLCTCHIISRFLSFLGTKSKNNDKRCIGREEPMKQVVQDRRGDSDLRIVIKASNHFIGTNKTQGGWT